DVFVPDALLTGVFTDERDRLVALAYRMTGSWADAEDVVQETWVRWSSVDRRDIRSPVAWLTTVTTRLAIDRRRSIDRRREQYVGPWLPEPASTTPGPEDDLEMSESLTLGFLVLLDRLSPTERAVFLLAEVFGEPYSTIADAVGKTPAACRQIASRARQKIRGARDLEGAGITPSKDRPDVGDVEPADHELIKKLLVALSLGDAQRVAELLDPSVTLVTDGGPSRHAARRPVVGPYRVTRLLLNLSKRLTDRTAHFSDVNGSLGLVFCMPDGSVDWVASCDQVDGRIAHIWVMGNPDKLARVRSPLTQ
ncbi:MAG TPA: RNA polymerase sigma factor SigJ, partial [Acidimicrobiales bacterium]|nr:RNA polymerase sigma factor SigJ [Acidimicrobiales bacterium]